MMRAAPARRRIWVALLIANLLLAAATVNFGRRFSIDETWYKAAGMHLALDGRFAAPEIDGAMPARAGAAVVFASQPPVYPFLFAGVVKAFGFGPDQIVAYDAAIRVGLSLLCFALLSVVAVGDWVAAGLALLVWPLGTSGRPDELGMAFGIVAVLLTRRGSAMSVALAGAALGLSAATSVGCGITYGLACLAVVRPGTSRAWTAVAIGAAVAALVFAAIVAPVWLGHPGSFGQFRSNSRDATALTGFVRKWRNAMRLVNPAGPVAVGLFVAVTAIAIANRGRSEWGRLAAAAAVAFAFVFVRLPGKYPYLWMATPVAAAAVVGWARSADPRPRWGRCVAIALLAMAAVGSSLSVRDAILVLRCPAEQRARSVAAQLRARIPMGSVVFGDDVWSMIGDRCLVHDGFFVLDRQLPSVQYMVVSTDGVAGTGHHKRLRPSQADELADHFELVADLLPRWQPRVLGVRVGRATFGYGPAIYRRVRPT